MGLITKLAAEKPPDAVPAWLATTTAETTKPAEELTDDEWARRFITYEYVDKKTKITHLVIQRRDFRWT